MEKEQTFKDGRKLLIEYDSGYISPDENKVIISEMKDVVFSEDLVLHAVLQKYDTPNKNGRIYPESILKRENEKYQQAIKRGNALNELNHPSCHTGDVDILTIDGWKNIKEIDEFEKIITLNDNGIIEDKIIYSKVKHKYDGKMFHLKGQDIDVIVTPNHKFPIVDDTNKEITFITSQDIFDKINNNISLSNYYIPKNGEILSDEKHDYVSFNETINVRMDLFMSFMGLYLSKGETLQNENVVILNIDKNKILFDVELLLISLTFNFKKIENDNGTLSFIIDNNHLWEFLKPLNEKHIPNVIKNVSSKYFKYLIKWFNLSNDKNDDNVICSTSEKLINDFQEISIKYGLCGDLMKNENDTWVLDLNKTKKIYLNNDSLNITEINNNDGYVYSVDVPNHIYYVRSNGKCHWSGNSSLIDLDRVSHSILETWWDGKILMGKIKIFTSPGWRKMGIVSTKGDTVAMLLMNGATLGISSRGVGSLKTEKGNNVVQDDFELVCYDIVSSPSTPGAYIFKDASERDYYQESIENNSTINTDRLKKLMGNFDNFLSKK